MSEINDLQVRLTQYLATEKEILTEGQKVTDEDDRELQRANLSSVREAIKNLRNEIAMLKKPQRFGVRQYSVRV